MPGSPWLLLSRLISLVFVIRHSALPGAVPCYTSATVGSWSHLLTRTYNAPHCLAHLVQVQSSGGVMSYARDTLAAQPPRRVHGLLIIYYSMAEARQHA